MCRTAFSLHPVQQELPKNSDPDLFARVLGNTWQIDLNLMWEPRRFLHWTSKPKPKVTAKTLM